MKPLLAAALVVTATLATALPIAPVASAQGSTPPCNMPEVNAPVCDDIDAVRDALMAILNGNPIPIGGGGCRATEVAVGGDCYAAGELVALVGDTVAQLITQPTPTPSPTPPGCNANGITAGGGTCGPAPPPPSCNNPNTIPLGAYSLLCQPIQPCNTPVGALLDSCGGSLPAPPGGTPGNPCGTLPQTLPPCGPVPGLPCGTVQQCIPNLIPCLSQGGSYCNVGCILPGVPVVSPGNPITPTQGGVYVNIATVTVTNCNGSQVIGGQQIFLPIQADCPEMDLIEVPENPRLLDQDGDGIPALYYDTAYYRLDANCGLTRQYTGTHVLPFPDPDDGNPTVICGPAQGTQVEAPSGALIQDRDGDGWENVYVQMTAYELDGNCNLVQVGQREVPLNVPDPDDQDPNVPPAIAPCPNGGQSCPIAGFPVVTLCGIEDADADRVPIAYVCEADLEVYNNGGYKLHQQPTQGGYGDPDDNDPCVPIGDARLNPACRYDGRRFPDQGQGGEVFHGDTDHRKWWDLLTAGGFPWWLLIALLLVALYYYGREKQEKGKARRRRR